jgi:hypothetical protein
VREGYIKKLYLRGLSGSQIAQITKTQLRQVYRTLAKVNVPRRSSAEQNRLNFLRSPLSFRFKKHLSVYERELLVAAVMLYYGEGAKTGKTVDLANSDPKILQIFLKFLRGICRVNDKRLRFYLYCFSDQNPEKIIKFWCNFLHIRKASFTKPYIRNVDGKLLRTMQFGVLHIRYSDSRLLKVILGCINELIIKYGGVAE